jgi:hypothetical protein
VLEIRKIIKEIESITATLRDEENAESIVRAKEVAMENAQQSILAPKLSSIESLIAQVQAKVIDVAGLERYMSEAQALLDWMEEELDTFAPHIETVLVERLEAREIVPDVDLMEAMLKTSGTAEAFEALKRQAEQETEYAPMEEEIREVERKAETVNVEDSMKLVQGSLSAVTSDSGISTEEYSPESISRKIDRIAREANLELGTGESEGGE